MKLENYLLMAIHNNMNIKNNKTIGVIGGMGPQASAYFYNLIIKKAIKDFKAVNGDDFPNITLFSIPVPDFISNKKNIKVALRMLKNKLYEANKLKLSNISIVCNTAHLLMPKLKNELKIPFISLIEEVAKRVKDKKINKAGILGSPTTLKSGLYQRELNRLNIKAIIPNGHQIKILNTVIRNVIGGKSSNVDKENLIKIVKKLKKRGAQGIVLGCTELPIVFPKIKNILVFNSVEILVDSLLKGYYQ